MKVTFKSEQYGTTVEMNFEAVTLSEIEDMYKQFLRGSGFYLVEDKDDMSTKQENVYTSEECVHESDMAYRPNVLTIEQEKQWVGLTDEEIAETVGSPLDEVYLFDFRRVIAKLKEKNK
jgi:hypothetical protein